MGSRVSKGFFDFVGSYGCSGFRLSLLLGDFSSASVGIDGVSTRLVSVN
jgi:hypothetical protein